MATNAFSGGITVKRGDGDDPEVFTTVPECIVVPVMGASKSEIDVSSCDSVTNKDFIPEYLGEGESVTAEFNYVIGDTEQLGMIADYNNSTNRNYEITITNGTDVLTTVVTLSPIGWARTPSFTEQHKLAMNFKISGAISDTVS